MSSAAVNAAIAQMIAANTDKLVHALAAKYDFDPAEALESLGDLVIQKKEAIPRKSKSKVATIEAPPSDKPKRAKTGYLLHQDSVRAQCRAELEEEAEEGVKVMAKDVVRGIAAKWKELSDEEIAEWKEVAAAAKSPTPSGSEDEVEEE